MKHDHSKLRWLRRIWSDIFQGEDKRVPYKLFQLDGSCPKIHNRKHLHMSQKYAGYIIQLPLNSQYRNILYLQLENLKTTKYSGTGYGAPNISKSLVWPRILYDNRSSTF